MEKKNVNEYPFDKYIKILIQRKITKKAFLKYSDEVFKLIENIKKKKLKIIKSKYFGDIIVPKANNGIKKNFYDLFAFHELSLFAKYIKLKNKFNYALDIGANLGLHTIILSRLGYNVKSFEADPTTFKKLKINLERNLCQNYKIYNFAVSDFNGSSKFYQVTDNLTANTLENSSKKVYGKFKVIKVNVKKIAKYLPKSNVLIKLDVEGAEYNILKTIKFSNNYKKKIFLEVNDNISAEKIFNFVKSKNLNCFAEINLWKKVKYLSEMPSNWKHGSILIDK